jgi:hypothetical protein
MAKLPARVAMSQLYFLLCGISQHRMGHRPENGHPPGGRGKFPGRIFRGQKALCSLFWRLFGQLMTLMFLWHSLRVKAQRRHCVGGDERRQTARNDFMERGWFPRAVLPADGLRAAQGLR